MRGRKLFRWILYFVGGLIASLVAVILLLALIRIPIDLSSQREMVASAASLALGRTVAIDDKIAVSTSLRPVFSLEGLRISNPKDFEKGDFLEMKLAEIRLRVLPLLRGKIRVDKSSVQGITVNLLENEQGAVNWSSQTAPEGEPEPPRPDKKTDLRLTSDALVLTKLVMEDITVNYHKPGMAESPQFQIDECTGTMLPGKPFVLEMTGKLSNEPYQAEIEIGSLEELIEKSRLTGQMTADRSGGRPKVTVELNSPLLQLNDFDVGEWSPEEGDAKPSAEEHRGEEKSTPLSIGEWLRSEVLTTFDVRLDVTAEKVISGRDELGSGVLTALLQDGRITVDPVRLNIPGGSFNLAASLKPDTKAPEASLKMKVANFDFGVPVRQADPASDMGGMINLDVDLKSSAPRFSELMASGNGYFDFSGRLENIKAGIIDLWAVNVLAAVLSRGKAEESNINCLVGRWTMKDGVLTPDLLLVDTTKIRICGTGRVDFTRNHIDLKMAPTPKKAEYFSLATPIEVKGNFRDFGVGIKPSALVGTTLRFVASPITTTLKRLVNMELPADGSDVCALPIGSGNRSTDAPKGCRY